MAERKEERERKQRERLETRLRKQAEKEERTRQQAEKKEERARQKGAKKAAKGKKDRQQQTKGQQDVQEQSENICQGCGGHYEDDDEDAKEGWIGCDEHGCWRWYHYWSAGHLHLPDPRLNGCVQLAKRRMTNNPKAECHVSAV